MIILLPPSDTLSVATTDVGPLDVHASWLDSISGQVGVGRINTSIAVSGVAEIVTTPPTGTNRNVRTLHIRNRGGSSNDVTVLHWDGTLAVELYKQTLPPDTQFQYVDGVGFVTLGAAL